MSAADLEICSLQINYITYFEIFQVEILNTHLFYFNYRDTEIAFTVLTVSVGYDT